MRTCAIPPGLVTAASSPASHPAARERWLPRLLAGGLTGIAITEPHGGSQVHATATIATAHTDGSWKLVGTKTWISRLEEADVFVAFSKDSAGRLTAGVIDAAAEGLCRRPVVPAGLSGWTWGELLLDGVLLYPCDLLGRLGEGMALLREHFAHYRPLVAATALGAPAAVHDLVAMHLHTRRSEGIIADLRDNALIALGRSYGQINAALLAALATLRLSEAHDQWAHVWGCAVKAHAADTAHAAVSDLVLLAGAAGFTATSRLAKAERELRALLYADGIHDSLYRAAGRALTATGHGLAKAIAVPQTPRGCTIGSRPDPWERFTSPGELAASFRHFAVHRCGDYAPLYSWRRRRHRRRPGPARQ